MDRLPKITSPVGHMEVDDNVSRLLPSTYDITPPSGAPASPLEGERRREQELRDNARRS